MTGVEDIKDRLGEVLQRIDAVRAEDQTVSLVAVSKRFSADVAASAFAAGCEDLGENYAQELQGKAVDLADRGLRPRWHMIGPVQRNKVRKIASIVTLWHSVDRPELLTEIAKRTDGTPNVLLQVNFTEEDSKSGSSPDQLDSLLDHAREVGVEVRGLMAMGPTDTSVDPRPTFAACRAAVDRLGLAECSIGMSGDFELAIQEGSTMVRIGSAIFGPRS